MFCILLTVFQFASWIPVRIEKKYKAGSWSAVWPNARSGSALKWDNLDLFKLYELRRQFKNIMRRWYPKIMWQLKDTSSIPVLRITVLFVPRFPNICIPSVYNKPKVLQILIFYNIKTMTKRNCAILHKSNFPYINKNIGALITIWNFLTMHWSWKLFVSKKQTAIYNNPAILYRV